MKRKLFGSSEPDEKIDPNGTPSEKKRRRKNAAETPKHYPKSERQQLALVLQMTSVDNSPEPASPPPVTPRRTPGGSGRKDKIHKRNERGETQMHLCTIRGDLDAMKELIRQGADVNVQDFAGWTPLHEACNHGHQEITRYLLINGANVNSKGLEDDTPLHDAVTNSHRELVELLLRYGADPLLKNKRGQCPLDVAEDQYVKDSMLRALETRRNRDSERERSSSTHSDISEQNSVVDRAADSPNSDRYLGKASVVTNGAFSSDSSCDETHVASKNSVEHRARVNGCRSDLSVNSTPKSRKTKRADTSSKTCFIKSSIYSDSSSVDSSLSSSSDSSSDSDSDNERGCSKNGRKPKFDKADKAKFVGKDCAKRKSLFTGDKSRVTAKMTHGSSQNFENKANSSQRARSSSLDDRKPAALQNTDVSKLNGIEPFPPAFDTNGGGFEGSIYDFSTSVEDMSTDSAISLKREYRDKSSELFDILCLGKGNDATDSLRLKLNMDKSFPKTDAPKEKSVYSSVTDRVGNFGLFDSDNEKPARIHTSLSTPVISSNGLQNEHNHVRVKSEKCVETDNAPAAQIKADPFLKDDSKSEKKIKKHAPSPKKTAGDPTVNSVHELKKETVGKGDKKKKIGPHGHSKTLPLDNKHVSSHSHKKKKKHKHKHSLDTQAGEEKNNSHAVSTEATNVDKSNEKGTNAVKQVGKRPDPGKVLQRKFSLDGRPGSVKKKVRSSDSVSSETSFKNNKHGSSSPHKALKRSNSSQSQERLPVQNATKKDKPEQKRRSLVMDASCSFLSELEKSSRQRLEQEKRMKLLRKKKLSQLKAVARGKDVKPTGTSTQDKVSRERNLSLGRNGGILERSFSQTCQETVSSPLREHSNSMNAIDAMQFKHCSTPARTISQIAPIGDGLSPFADSPVFVGTQDNKPAPAHRSLSFSCRLGDALETTKMDGFSAHRNTAFPENHRHSIAEAPHVASDYAGPSRHLLVPPVNGLSPPANHLKAQSFLPSAHPVQDSAPCSSLEPFPSNVPSSSPMVATRVPDQSPTATHPTGSTSVVTAALPERGKMHSTVGQTEDDIQGKLSASNEDDDLKISEQARLQKKEEEESEELRLLEEKREAERKEALRNHINQRLSLLGDAIDEKVPKKLPVYIPVSKLDSAGDKDPLRDRMNIYEERMIIRKQIWERRKKYYASVAVPQAPNRYLEYVTCRGAYLLAGRKESWLSVPVLAPPSSLGEELRALFVEHEKERVKTRLRHAAQREKLVVACEQEILRVHGRAARMLQNQRAPFSACSVFLDGEVYHLERRGKKGGDDDNNSRASIRDRFNGRMMLSWLQDVDDKYVKIKAVLLSRQRHESQALRAVQRTEWFLKSQESESQGQQKRGPESKPEDVSELYVPSVNLSDDFALLPG